MYIDNVVVVKFNNVHNGEYCYLFFLLLMWWCQVRELSETFLPISYGRILFCDWLSEDTRLLVQTGVQCSRAKIAL